MVYLVMKPTTAGCDDVLYRMMKRMTDVIFAMTALMVFSPVMLVIYIAIKSRKDGPAIFSQERIGLHGKPFTLYKFRTMTSDAENAGPQLCKNGDSRLTPVGKFLREHHLDEFPQLWNVLRGDMSFVGYRPERMYYIKKIMEHDLDYELLFRQRPGLFSEATLYNGYTDTMEKMLERLRYDLEYLYTCSLSKDMSIIIKTSLSIIFGKKF